MFVNFGFSNFPSETSQLGVTNARRMKNPPVKASTVAARPVRDFPIAKFFKKRTQFQNFFGNSLVYVSSLLIDEIRAVIPFDQFVSRVA